MNAIHHSQAHALGNLAAPGAREGRVQRIAEWKQHKAIQTGCVNEGLRLLREYFQTPELVHQAICALSASAKDQVLREALAMFADEIDPTPNNDGEAA